MKHKKIKNIHIAIHTFSIKSLILGIWQSLTEGDIHTATVTPRSTHERVAIPVLQQKNKVTTRGSLDVKGILL